MARATGAPGRAATLLQRHWWRPATSWLAWLLMPLAWLYRVAATTRRAFGPRPQFAPVPTLVVGNLVVGGAGKTPLVIVLVQALRAQGRHPGVISRGHGRAAGAVQAVDAASDPAAVGDEPLLIRRRTGAPVWVGRRRLEAARALCHAHPEVDVIVSDDGLQHHALKADAALVVFDDRGAGNGRLLPAGPLRAPLPRRASRHLRVVYTGRRPSTPLPGLLVPRHAAHAVPLTAWARGEPGGVPLASLRGRPLLALAGIGEPEKFFDMLETCGLEIRRLPRRDHATYPTAPWPPGTPEVVTTEKDAVKLARLPGASFAATTVWVVPLDCELPGGLVEDLLGLLRERPA